MIFLNLVATKSSAASHETGTLSDFPFRGRNKGRVARSGVWTVGPSWAPFAQSFPRLAAADSTPRTRVTSPASPSTFSRQPTPQYGQTDSPSTPKAVPFLGPSGGRDVKGRHQPFRGGNATPVPDAGEVG